MTYVGLTGGQIFHQLMLKHNVKVVFGYPGGAILPVYDAMSKVPAIWLKVTLVPLETWVFVWLPVVRALLI
jgi:thiamine pyrophosphate-dependent acetolactate synthase large subunit-like protein